MPLPKEFPVRVVAGMPVVTAPRCVDIANADDLGVALLGAAAMGYATVVVDLSNTELCDSSALRELERGQLRARAEGGELRLVTPAARLRRVFELVGMHTAFRMYPTLTDALDELPVIAIVAPPGTQTYPTPTADSSAEPLTSAQ
jgi:anti-sigma B factor antagonist